MAGRKEPPLLVGLIVLFLGGIGFLVTLLGAACSLIVEDYRPYAPYWCAARWMPLSLKLIGSERPLLRPRSA